MVLYIIAIYSYDYHFLVFIAWRLKLMFYINNNLCCVYFRHLLLMRGLFLRFLLL